MYLFQRGFCIDLLLAYVLCSLYDLQENWCKSASLEELIASSHISCVNESTDSLDCP